MRQRAFSVLSLVLSGIFKFIVVYMYACVSVWGCTSVGFAGAHTQERGGPKWKAFIILFVIYCGRLSRLNPSLAASQLASGIPSLPPGNGC